MRIKTPLIKIIILTFVYACYITYGVLISTKVFNIFRKKQFPHYYGDLCSKVLHRLYSMVIFVLELLNLSKHRLRTETGGVVKSHADTMCGR